MQKTLIGLFLAVLFILASMTSAGDAFNVGLDLSYAWPSHCAEGEDSAVNVGAARLQFMNRLHPAFQLINEITVGRMKIPDDDGIIAGVNEVGRISLYSSKDQRKRIFLDVGVGINYIGLRLPELTGSAQFTALGGVGFFYKPSGSSLAYVASYRLTHISNASTQQPNIGLNLHTLGISFIFL